MYAPSIPGLCFQCSQAKIWSFQARSERRPDAPQNVEEIQRRILGLMQLERAKSADRAGIRQLIIFQQFYQMNFIWTPDLELVI